MFFKPLQPARAACALSGAGRCAVLMALLLAFAQEASAQFPGFIRPFRSPDELILRADRAYDYGREVEAYAESRRALQTAIPLYEEFLERAPDHAGAQQARYRLGMAQLLTGRLEDAERNFQFIIRRYKTGHYVATAAYRIAAQRYNAKRWADASPYFKIAAAQAEKQDLRHKSQYYRARCLILSNQGNAAIVTLESMVADPTNPFKDYARLAVGQIYAAREEHEKALEHFELLLTPHTAPQERAQALLAAGVSAAALQDEERAAKYLDQTLQNPSFDNKFKARAQLSLMEMRFREDDYPGVIRELSRGEFSGEDEVQASIYLLAGRAFAQLDRHSEAIRYYFNAQRRLPRESHLAREAAYRRILSFYALGDQLVADQADAYIAVYGRQTSNPDWLNSARLMKAETLLHANKPVEAAEAYREISAQHLPEALRADFHFKSGWAFAEAGEHNAAAQNLSRFLMDHPDHPQRLSAMAQRGKSYLEIGDRKSARKDFEDVLAANPPDELTLFAKQNLGRIYRENRRYDALVECYTTMLAEHSDLDRGIIANANYWIGWGHFKLDQFGECLAPLQKARELDPALYSEPASTHLMLAAYSLKDAAELRKQVDRIREEFPHKTLPVRMLTWLGLQLFQMGDFKGADTYLTMASTPDEPSYTDLLVWRQLGKARTKIMHYDRALAAIEITLEREDKDFWRADAYLDKAHALIGKEEWEQAREAAHEALSLEPPGTVTAELYMALGDIAMERTDYESAAANFLRTANLFIDDTEIKPRALARAAEALAAAGEDERADEIRAELREKYPGVEVPGGGQ